MNKPRRISAAVLTVLLAALLVWLDHNLGRFQSQTASPPQQHATAGDREKYHGRTFLTTKVVDGDTLDIDIPDGRYDHTRIRLWGVDTPEISRDGSESMYFGPEASDFAESLVRGKPVCVYLDENNDTRDKYGRLLAYVKLTDGRFLNEVLLSEGYAYADVRFQHGLYNGYAYADVRFQHGLYNKYIQLETTARTLKKGLWKAVTREQLPDWLQRKKPELLAGK